MLYQSPKTNFELLFESQRRSLQAQMELFVLNATPISATLEFTICIKEDEVQEMIPSDQDKKCIRALCQNLVYFYFAGKELQRDAATRSNTAATFDASITTNECTHGLLSAKSSTVDNSAFKSVFAKVENNDECKLIIQERQTIYHIKLDKSSNNSDKKRRTTWLPLPKRY